jgi:hypothetical protein
MAQADVLQLVTDIADGLNDTTACTNYYGDVVFLMGLDPDGTIVNCTTFDPGLGTLDVSLPANSITTLVLIYDRVHLSKTTLLGAAAWDTQWATTLSTPLSWLDQAQPRHTISLVPQQSKAPSGAALPLDPSLTDPGFDAVTALYTETRANVHGDEELALALEIVSREFSRDSDHTDRTLGQSCRTLSGILFRMLDIAIEADTPPLQDVATGDGGGE